MVKRRNIKKTAVRRKDSFNEEIIGIEIPISAGGPLENSVMKPKENTNKELYWVFGAMVGLVIIFLVSYSIFQGLKNINYQGLSFKKEMFGQIPLYHYYYIGKVKTITGGVISEQNKKVDLFLRNDPNENNITVDGEIIFPEDKSVYIGIGNEGISNCKYTVIGLATLSSFLSQNGISVKAGVADLEDAKANNLTHISCEKYPSSAVILIEKGEKTKITKSKGYCYTISVNNCETLPAMEKFIVQSLIDARGRAKSSGQYKSDVTL